MSEYLNHEDAEAMSMALTVYDVDQGGWEHEEKGLEFNLEHVLKELVRARRKDFFDPDVVRTEVAPDAMQYSFRIARWTGFKRELVLPSMKIEKVTDNHAKQMRTASRRIGAYAAGEIMLADFVHKLDHASEQQAARQAKFEALPRVSQALMLFALDSANEFDFRPRNAFIDRLTNLRERFDIPQPTK
jgi:hypothetical protein